MSACACRIPTAPIPSRCAAAAKCTCPSSSRRCGARGMEFAVSRPHVIFKRDEKGHRLEPMERLTVDVPEEFVGNVIEKVRGAQGRDAGHAPQWTGGMRLEFSIPARGLMGYRSEF